MSDADKIATESADDDLQKALAAFGDDVLDLLADDDDDCELEEGLECFQETQDAEISQTESNIDALLERFQDKFGSDSTIGYAGTVAVACNKASKQTAVSESRSIVFSIGDQLFALPLPSVPEIARLGEITTLPRTPAWLCGVTNLRGELVPVFDPRLLTKLPEPSQTIRNRHQKLILLNTDQPNSRIALLVDQIAGIHSLDEHSAGAPEPDTGSLSNLSSETVVWNDQTIFLLDPDRLVSQFSLQV